MFGIARVSSWWGSSADRLGGALLNLSFLRLGIARPPSVEELPDRLCRDIGLPPRQKPAMDPRDFRR